MYLEDIFTVTPTSSRARHLDPVPDPSGDLPPASNSPAALREIFFCPRKRRRALKYVYLYIWQMLKNQHRKGRGRAEQNPPRTSLPWRWRSVLPLIRLDGHIFILPTLGDAFGIHLNLTSPQDSITFWLSEVLSDAIIRSPFSGIHRFLVDLGHYYAKFNCIPS